MNITFNVPTDKRGERLQVYINGSPGRKRGKKTYKHTNTQTHKHTDTLTPTKYSFSLVTHSKFGIGGSVAGATPVQDSSFLSILRIRIQEDDFILDDLIRLTI